jgi:hypothetical protein
MEAVFSVDVPFRGEALYLGCISFDLSDALGKHLKKNGYNKRRPWSMISVGASRRQKQTSLW